MSEPTDSELDEALARGDALYAKLRALIEENMGTYSPNDAFQASAMLVAYMIKQANGPESEMIRLLIQLVILELSKKKVN